MPLVTVSCVKLPPAALTVPSTPAPVTVNSTPLIETVSSAVNTAPVPSFKPVTWPAAITGAA